jgi:predicted RNA-binding protein YlxR (DUF448 family)
VMNGLLVVTKIQCVKDLLRFIQLILIVNYRNGLAIQTFTIHIRAISIAKIQLTITSTSQMIYLICGSTTQQNNSMKRKQSEWAIRMANKRPSKRVVRVEVFNSLHLSKKKHPSRTRYIHRKNSCMESKNNRRMESESKTN